MNFPDDAKSYSNKISYSLLVGTCYAHKRFPSIAEKISLFNALGRNVSYFDTNTMLKRVYEGELIIFWQNDQWCFADADDQFMLWLKTMDPSTMADEDSFTPSEVPQQSSTTHKVSEFDDNNQMYWPD